MIVGIGVDVVDLARFDRAITRTLSLRSRLFTPAERGLPLASLAGRFAAKEALIKALGDSTGVTWQDMEIVSDSSGNPSFVLHNAVAAIAAARGITVVHVSMSHDGGVAIAYVIAEGPAPAAAPAAAPVAPSAVPDASPPIVPRTTE